MQNIIKIFCEVHESDNREHFGSRLITFREEIRPIINIFENESKFHDVQINILQTEISLAIEGAIERTIEHIARMREAYDCNFPLLQQSTRETDELEQQ
jgi:hypothetical protein